MTAWCLLDAQQSTDSAVSRPSLPPQSWAGLSLSRRQGPLPDRCSGLASLDAPWSPWRPSFLCSDVGTQDGDICARLTA